MNILSAEKISKSYSEKALFKEISLGINEGEKIGLIGVNGTGKSTLLKVLAGLEPMDTGRIITANGLTIEYLAQNPHFEAGMTVLEHVFKGTSPLMQLLREYEGTLQLLGENPGDSRLEKSMLLLTQRMEEARAWTLESEAKTVLTKLGIVDFNADVGRLSGGQKKRAAMAAALISPAGLLILDEPTNHIDNATVEWLEKYLNGRKGALLMVTHDRYFLGRVCNRIIELDAGRLFSYQADYEGYLEAKAEREEMEQSSEKKRRNLLRQELEWIRRGARARSTKQKARIERFEKLNGEQVPEVTGSVEIAAAASRLGRKTIELDHVGKSFPGIEVIRDFSYIVLRDDRVGIIGPNGSGKSTLLKLIAGRLAPNRGSISTGETVRIGFFSQESEGMDENLRVIEYIREAAEYVTTGEGTISASQMLERFLFPPAVQWTPVSRLSGGEKRRLYLLRILMGAPNILLLDEPTNDLDIKTLTILEDYLDEFRGAVIAVSHDRYFLDRVADKIFAFEGGGSIQKYEGNYSFYTEALERRIDEQGAGNEQSGARAGKDTGSGANAGSRKDKAGGIADNKKERPVKFTFKEQKEFERIDETIVLLEKELGEVKAGMDEASADYGRLQELISRQEALEGQLEEAMERWVYLNELAEEISKNTGKQ